MRALLLALVLLPAAQAVSLEVSTPPAQFVPDAPWSGEVTVTIPCTEVIANAAQTVVWGVEAGPYNVSGARSAVIGPSACATPTGSFVQTFPITVTGDRTIEAEESLDALFHAQLGDAGDTRADKTVEFEMQFVGRLTALAPAMEKQAGPQKALPYDIVLTNQANGRMLVTFEIGVRPEEGQLIVPDNVILESGDTVTVTAVYATPFANGYNDVEEPFSLIAHPSSINGTGLDDVEVSLNGATKGFYVPGPGILAPLLVAFALRRR